MDAFALTPSTFYNDNDTFCVKWLFKLCQEAALPPGKIDDRPIEELKKEDIHEYNHVHLFAGIGGWPYALQLAGWPDEWTIWTGSCPCQPYSNAGKRLADKDPRNLWPQFRRLIDECRPPVVVGEQVASKDGRLWLAGVRADLETLGYAVGAADLCAAGVGAPHIRQRLWWVAYANGQRQVRVNPLLYGKKPGRHAQDCAEIAGGGVGSSGMGDDPNDGCEHTSYETERQLSASGRGAINGPWSNAVLLPCADGKARRVEPGIFPLAYGIPNRMGTLRGAGNAIVPQVAAVFLQSVMDIIANGD